MEHWKDIKGYEGLYRVSDMGKVKRIKHVSVRVSHGNLPLKEKSMAISINRTGYCQVALTKNGLRKQKLVHRLVLSTFKPIDNEDEYQVNHIDGNPLNNSLDNLEWNTLSENIHHAIRIGHRRKPLKIGLFVDGKLINEYPNTKSAAESCSMSLGHLKRVLSKGLTTKYGTFKYIV